MLKDCSFPEFASQSTVLSDQSNILLLYTNEGEFHTDQSKSTDSDCDFILT